LASSRGPRYGDGSWMCAVPVLEVRSPHAQVCVA
jgi:hypothetical protein